MAHYLTPSLMLVEKKNDARSLALRILHCVYLSNSD